MDAQARYEYDSLRQAHSPAEAARIALGLRQYTVPEYVAKFVADAVLGHADNVISAKASIHRHMWQDIGAREYALQHLRHQLQDEITSQGFVPTALPTQTLSYVQWTGTAIPHTPGDTEPENWDQVLVALSVPVRIPPVDRKAAVKAGILGGAVL